MSLFLTLHQQATLQSTWYLLVNRLCVTAPSFPADWIPKDNGPFLSMLQSQCLWSSQCVFSELLFGTNQAGLEWSPPTPATPPAASLC